MSIVEQVQEKVKEAMKAGDAVARDCLRGIIADIKNLNIVIHDVKTVNHV